MKKVDGLVACSICGTHYRMSKRPSFCCGSSFTESVGTVWLPVLEPLRAMSDKWKAQLFSEKTEETDDYEENHDYEYAAVRESNKHGQESWGWGDDDKIILFSCGIGCNNTYNHKKAKRIVRAFVDMLNSQNF